MLFLIHSNSFNNLKKLLYSIGLKSNYSRDTIMHSSKSEGVQLSLAWLLLTSLFKEILVRASGKVLLWDDYDVLMI